MLATCKALPPIYSNCFVRCLSLIRTSQQSSLPTRKVAYDYGPLKHTTIVQNALKSVVKYGDSVVDATCGNGKDSLFLASLALHDGFGELYCIDIQQDAIDSTRTMFEKSDQSKGFVFNGQVKFICASHETFPSEIKTCSVAAICYNLGYLPGKKRSKALSDTSSELVVNNGTVQTLPESTIKSILAAQSLIKEGGILIVTAYPMHKGTHYRRC